MSKHKKYNFETKFYICCQKRDSSNQKNSTKLQMTADALVLFISNCWNMFELMYEKVSFVSSAYYFNLKI